MKNLILVALVMGFAFYLAINSNLLAPIIFGG